MKYMPCTVHAIATAAAPSRHAKINACKHVSVAPRVMHDNGRHMGVTAAAA